ncbi:zinc finger HIT domain-containing protein [Aspergillus mulundensis]|uniref:HIT-type domain-containing protein n=1 Tax=Aspergillus mulundensis TaxID=1810919 RepID=A0A3D8R9M6_9EURO|nr:hypothetical protein DSM5745_08119 [Aspergillus mulundensis]RDW70608.1 hypothetical protein DSM5745_08119 [Aspergillus mulundensis]
MTSLCEVCASEPSKYRCPTCELMSCSLACTRTHKIYCAPKAPKDFEDATDTLPQSSEAHGHEASYESQPVRNGHDLTPQGLSTRIKDVLERYPPLRDQLRDIYTATLEEQWVEGPAYKDRPRHFGRGKQPPRSHGPWTREKGFKRGLGKVRKYRGQCDDGSETGKVAEGFMRLLTLVNEGQLQEHQ